MITIYDYLTIRKDPSKDVMPVLYHFFLLRGGTPIGNEVFGGILIQWLRATVGLEGLGRLIEFVFSELDKEYAEYLA